MDLSDFEMILIDNFVNGAVMHLELVVRSSITWLENATVSNTTWESIAALFRIILPHWNCDIHILYIDNTFMNDVPDDFGSEHLRQM